MRYVKVGTGIVVGALSGVIVQDLTVGIMKRTF
jgi:uncharacterized protein YqgC (DUF456 family)